MTSRRVTRARRCRHLRPHAREPRDRAVRRERRPRQAQAPARALPPDRSGPDAAATSGSSAARATRSPTTSSGTLARAAVKEFGRRPATDDCWDPFAARLTLRRDRRGARRACRDAVGAAVEEIGGEPRLLHYLSVPPNAAPGVIEELGRVGLADRARVIMEKPFGVDLESARRLNATRPRACSTSRRSSASTTSWARRRFRTSSRCASPTGCSSRSGTATTSTTCRSTFPRRCRSARARGSTSRRAPTATWSSRTCSRCSGFVAMEPPTAITSEALVAEKLKVFDTIEPVDPPDVVRGQYEGYREIPGVAPGSDTETFVAAEGVSWTAGAGRACRSTCAPASASIARGTRSRSASASRRAASSTLAPRRAGSEPDHVRPRRARLDHGELPRQGAGRRRCGWATARMRFEYEDSFSTAMQLEAYERLLHDAMIGDRMLFTSAERDRAALGGVGAPARQPAAGDPLSRRGRGGRRRRRRWSRPGTGICPSMNEQTHERLAILFDIDGTLIVTGGAGGESWRRAFVELYGVAGRHRQVHRRRHDRPRGRAPHLRAGGRPRAQPARARAPALAPQHAAARCGRGVEGLPRAAGGEASCCPSCAKRATCSASRPAASRPPRTSSSSAPT